MVRQSVQFVLVGLSGLGWLCYITGFALLYRNLTSVNEVLPIVLGMSYRLAFAPFWVLAGSSVLLYALMVAHTATITFCYSDTRSKVVEAALMFMGVVYMLSVSCTIFVSVALISGDFFTIYFMIPRNYVVITLTGSVISLIFYWVTMVMKPLLEIKCQRRLHYHELN